MQYFVAIDPSPITVPLIPSISEEVARARAYEYCVQNNFPADATRFVSWGLRVGGEVESQYIFWGFEIPRADDYFTGGSITVDAHTGEVRSFLRNM